VHTTCVHGGTKKLPFAGYSIVRAVSHQLAAFSTIMLIADSSQLIAQKLFDIVWDDRRPPHRYLARQVVEPQATKIDDCRLPSRSRRFPVVIGEGSHPFPFRTRKLSPLPPMVLRGPTAWESRSLPGLFFSNARRLNKAAGVFFALMNQNAGPGSELRAR
jgi:hypothetical protein